MKTSSNSYVVLSNLFDDHQSHLEKVLGVDAEAASFRTHSVEEMDPSEGEVLNIALIYLFTVVASNKSHILRT